MKQARFQRKPHEINVCQVFPQPAKPIQQISKLVLANAGLLF
ncbi:MAG TPA: hypothetical protein VK753_03420 [Xanthomonadaceae bacterium]|nr:hypothetical protein [Xanthomonadaceae bacterium]